MVTLDKEEEAIEIRDVDDANSQSDDEVVEVVEPDKTVEQLEVRVCHFRVKYQAIYLGPVKTSFRDNITDT